MVKSVEITVLVHATEDEEKVRRAVLNLFPHDVEPPTLDSVSLTGYFGDPIKALKMMVKNRKPAEELLLNIVRSLNTLDQTTLIGELHKRLDETKNLYIRLDKQRALKGQMVLERHDSIRVKASLQVPHGQDPVETTRRYLEEAAGGIV